MKKSILISAATIILFACNPKKEDSKINSDTTLKPTAVTDTVPRDSDDPAIWVNKEDFDQSYIFGVDKSENGGLYKYNLDGKMDTSSKVTNLNRPNNVDIAYGFQLGDTTIDLAALTERKAGKMRIFSVPDLKPVDGGGIAIFEGEAQNEGMGIAFYTNKETMKIYAIVGRKEGPSGSYLWQYELLNGDSGQITAKVVRKFGQYSGEREIESIAVDNELGYIYYSDEGVGVRKYYADPQKGDKELALFATKGFTEDHEGISIYKTSEKEGYILVSDQEVNKFHIFPREGSATNPNEHNLIRIINVSANHSDGSEVSNVAFNRKYPNGIFVAMSDDKTYHIYDWTEVEAEIKATVKPLSKK